MPTSKPPSGIRDDHRCSGKATISQSLPSAGIGARLRAERDSKGICIPSPLAGEGPPPVSSPALGEEPGGGLPDTLPTLTLSAMLSKAREVKRRRSHFTRPPIGGMGLPAGKNWP
jgi:hypothetical protein